MTPLDELGARFRRLGVIEDTLGLLDWDQQTTMPEGSAEARGEQVATLQLIAHELLTHPRTGELLGTAVAGEAAADQAWAAANLREMRRRYEHAVAVPPALVEAAAKAASACEMRWRQARADNDFAGLRPLLDEVLRITRDVAAAKAEKLGLAPYDALLDQWEPGGRAADIDVVFAELAAFLPDLLGRVLEYQGQQPRPQHLAGPFPVERQRALGVDLMRRLGFDFNRGRLDISHHPFCGGATGDVRITTRYDEADFTSALMGVLHETGHALYEMGLPEAWRHQPVGVARGMAMHESQSLLIEMQVCRSRAFLTFAAPLMRDAFGGAGTAWEVDNLYRLYTSVEPSFIRVDADEVTYPAHVIVRYRLERALIGGDLQLADLPGAWNDAMVALLGIKPPDDRLGCLQDVHWPSGAWGYFPTYTLGAITAAQLFAAARRDMPALADQIAGGDFGPLVGWLGQHVHAKASSLDGGELIRQATGAPLATAAFKAHLEARYLN